VLKPSTYLFRVRLQLSRYVWVLDSTHVNVCFQSVSVIHKSDRAPEEQSIFGTDRSL
jgi:hypothetical protein